MKTILIVDDEPRTREGVRRVLEAWSAGRHRILTAAHAMEARRWLQEEGMQINVLITDIRMPRISGLDLIEEAVHMPHPPVVILISGYAEFEYAQKALKFGVIEYLLKPLDKEKLLQAVEEALEEEAERSRIELMDRLVDRKLMETAVDEQTYNPAVQEVVRYVEEHLHEPLQLKDLAEHLHMNASYLSALFKEQTGLTFSEYLMRRRVQRAKELLSSTQMTIQEIADATGYQTDKYFVKVFRSLEGISPGQYRKQLAQLDSRIE